MRGKIVNLCIGCMNILFGILLLIYTAYIPQELVELTIQELSVTRVVLKCIYVFMALIVIIDIIQYRTSNNNTKMKTGYLFGFFVLSFIFIKEPAISAFTIISGIIVIIESIKDPAVEIDSTTLISIMALIIVAILITIGAAVFYKGIGQYIKNKENEDTTPYETSYFKYITELDISDPYINVKKDGKYGYINQNGDIMIDFIYDYASPFINITVYNKDFQVALVTENNISKVILKNQREVMSYMSESANDNYAAKTEELENIYKNILGQGGKMETEIEKRTDQMIKAQKYDELPEDYTYRYDYNDEYDIIIKESNLGMGTKFELAKKDNLNIRINLDCNTLDYDDKNVYLYSNGSIPYFDIGSKEQGWFTNYGKKNTMSGKAQILDFIDDQILIRNYNDNTIYFIGQDGEMVSDVYKDIYVCQDRYIVKNNKGKYMVIDKEFNKVFEDEYDVIDPYLADYGIYIVTNTNEAIDFNDYNFAKMNWKLINSKGQLMIDGIEQIYGNYYEISTDKDKTYVDRYEEFVNNLKDIEFNFPGDKFYADYVKK